VLSDRSMLRWQAPCSTWPTSCATLEGCLRLLLLASEVFVPEQHICLHESLPKRPEVVPQMPYCHVTRNGPGPEHARAKFMSPLFRYREK